MARPRKQQHDDLPEAPKASGGLVPMVRDVPIHLGGPVTADVHPDEVQNWTAGGWVRAED